jgi:wyosine [tRNA(Phe)-imidazoG37] synthetase (radical SAM superfamily)
MRTLDFLDHSRQLGENRYVYAVVSRRVGGLSIGVNLNVDKACNFDCPYCQVDRTTPGGPRQIDVNQLTEELDRLLQLVAAGQLWSIPPFDTAAPALRRVGDISLAGDGEPTAAKEFEAVVRAVGRVRRAHGLEHIPLSLLSNATLFHRAPVRSGLEALAELDGRIWAKLDAGTEPFFHRVDGTSMPLQRVLDNLAWAASQWPIVLQCMFHTWQGEPPPDEEIAAWAGHIRALLHSGGRLSEIQIYTVARAPSDPRVGPLSTEQLDGIAAAVADLGVPLRVA